MEWLKRMSLKKSLFSLTLLSILIAALLTALLFWVYAKFNVIYAPKNMMLYVNQDYIIEPTAITGEPKQAYLSNLISFSQIALPVLFFVGALLCAVFLFYRLKLKKPLIILKDATARIMEGDLDFSVEAAAPDELGALCGAFETMRRALLANNQKLWRQAEEQKRLNAAFSHDLRNPLTVLKGSAKMAKRCAGDNEPLLSHLSRIETYTKRLERYVETMSSVSRLEQLPLDPTPFTLPQLSAELEDALCLLAADSGKELSFICARTPSCDGESARTEGASCDADRFGGAKPPDSRDHSHAGKHAQARCADKNSLLLIAENLVANALRFARQHVSVTLSVTERCLVLEVTDDGGGFPEKLLKNQIRPFQKGVEDASHFGMGLYICKLLCEKHGGTVEIENIPRGGACVRAILNTQNPCR